MPIKLLIVCYGCLMLYLVHVKFVRIIIILQDTLIPGGGHFNNEMDIGVRAETSEHRDIR